MLMRATGRGSISSFLKLAVDVAWVVACALLGFIWIIAAFSIYYLVTGDLLFPLFERVVVSTPRDLVVWSLNGSILCIGAMVVCAYLRGVFETLVARDPFVPENARRFAAIGIVLAIMEGASMFVTTVPRARRSQGPRRTPRPGRPERAWPLQTKIDLAFRGISDRCRTRTKQSPELVGTKCLYGGESSQQKGGY